MRITKIQIKCNSQCLANINIWRSQSCFMTFSRIHEERKELKANTQSLCETYLNISPIDLWVTSYTPLPLPLIFLLLPLSPSPWVKREKRYHLMPKCDSPFGGFSFWFANSRLRRQVSHKVERKNATQPHRFGLLLNASARRLSFLERGPKLLLWELYAPLLLAILLQCAINNPKLIMSSLGGSKGSGVFLSLCMHGFSVRSELTASFGGPVYNFPL